MGHLTATMIALTILCKLALCETESEKDTPVGTSHYENLVKVNVLYSQKVLGLEILGLELLLGLFFLQVFGVLAQKYAIILYKLGGSERLT